MKNKKTVFTVNLDGDIQKQLEEIYKRLDYLSLPFYKKILFKTKNLVNKVWKSIKKLFSKKVK